MSGSGRVGLEKGAQVLCESGLAIVVAVSRLGVQLRDVRGAVYEVLFIDLGPVGPLTPGAEGSVLVSLQPVWDGLSEAARSEALSRLEVVLEVETGYRLGHPELAQEGEPYDGFGVGAGSSLGMRCTRMAQLLTVERLTDRPYLRALITRGRTPGMVHANTVRGWVGAWYDKGLLGLVDGRRLQSSASFQTLPASFRSIASEVVGELDGDYSTVSHREVLRRIDERMRDGASPVPAVPERASRSYISWLMARQGRTTRAQRSRKLRKVSGFRHYPAMVPGQVVAIDATRADVQVWSARQGRAVSVEILLAIDVATRVILAARVVPMSADAQDAALLMYDVLRPFSQMVEGTTTSDWAWAGVPETVDLSGLVTFAADETPLADGPELQGLHRIPGVLPAAVRCDHGSIFVSQYFRELLGRLGIDMLLSRTRRPMDNATMERFNETIQRGLQQLPGYKGRNVAERGRLVGKPGAHDAWPLLTASELERFIRAWIALDYHRSPHSGLRIPGASEIDVTPLEMFDAMLVTSGRLHVPQNPDLLYDFMPVRWGTIRHAGVEFNDLVYDAPVLDPYRSVVPGTFRAQDGAAPFHYDPHDVSRVWFRDPGSGRVVPVEWRFAYMMDAPMSEALVAHLRSHASTRVGGARLRKNQAEKQILTELGSIERAVPRALRAQVAAADRRVEASRIDHDQAAAAMQIAALADADAPVRPVVEVDSWSVFDEILPDLRGQ